MKTLKRWLALCMTIVLLIGVAFESRSLLLANMTDNIDGTENTDAAAGTDSDAGATAQSYSAVQTEQQSEPAAAEEPQAQAAAEQPDAAGTQEAAGDTADNAVAVTEVEQPEQTAETPAEETPAEEAATNEAVQLVTEFKDENGNVVQRVTADVPAGAFEADAADISVEVDALGSEDAQTVQDIKDLINETLTGNDFINSYIFYDVTFKVNGQETEPKQAIKLTVEGSGLRVEDMEKVKCFFIDPADPAVADDQDEVTEITNKQKMIDELTAAGQSTENIDDYDLSEIVLGTDGVTADQIQMEGRKSTVYGCYIIEEKDPVELTAEVDGTTITLTGPARYFDDGKEYSIQAEKVEDEEVAATVEEAVDQMAAEKEKEVADYQAFDIKLLADGEEVQPKGAVEVKFSGQEVEESVEDENTEVSVIHVDEATGESTDMGAVATEENGVAIETEHFSVYVYVTLSDVTGNITITVEHWGRDVTTIKGTADATAQNGDTVYNTETKKINTEGGHREIYSPDTITIPNEYYENILDLSKVNNVENSHYEVAKVWITYDQSCKGEDWEAWYNPKKFTEYEVNDLTTESKITEYLQNGAIVRFWYDSVKEDNALEQPTTFYDYDITTGLVGYGVAKIKNTLNETDYLYTSLTKARNRNTTGGSEPTVGTVVTLLRRAYKTAGDSSTEMIYKVDYNGKAYWTYAATLNITVAYNKTGADNGTAVKYLMSDERGVNSDDNYSATTNTSKNNRLGVGQGSSGNRSSWAQTAVLQGTTDHYLNKASRNLTNWVVEGIVNNDLENGLLSNKVSAPTNLFSTGGTGSTPYTGYKLAFKQDGDTYTLQNVLDENGEVVNTAKNLDSIDKINSTYANNFWPLDSEAGTGNGTHDPLEGGSKATVTSSGKTKEKAEYSFVDKTGDIYNGENWNDDYGCTDVDNYNSEGHNWHFGMAYETTFKVSDYVGPMNFYFRGDDDFWLYVDGELVVDIGGVKLVQGESVDFWSVLSDGNLTSESSTADKEKFMEGKEDVEHTIKVYYMERGGFGSCCYIQFTIPNSEPVNVPTPETTEYSVEKKWDDNENPYRPGSITVRLIQQLNENEIETANTVTLSSENNWKKTWENLPKYNTITGEKYEYSYTVDEVNLPEGYQFSVEDGVMTNFLTDEGKVNVKITKQWENDEDVANIYRPSVTMQLYVDDDDNGLYEPYVDFNKNIKTITLDGTPDEKGETSAWVGEFTDLPKYYYTYDESTGEYTEYELSYCVKELQTTSDEIMGDKALSSGDMLEGKGGAKYDVSYGEVEKIEKTKENVYTFSCTITNTLRTDFIIEKQGESNENTLLSGAVFALTSTLDSSVQYTGTSNDSGVIEWKDANGNTVTPIPKGSYTMEETGAPSGYMVSEEKWRVNVKDYNRVEITTNNSNSGSTEAPINAQEVNGTVNADGTVIFAYRFSDKINYELPSVGGSGIYWYTVGGIVMMIGAALILYNTRRREVLGI